MTNPWTALDAATQEKGGLYLEQDVPQQIRTAFEPYESSLQSVLDDALDDTTGYFGTTKNPLAGVMQNAFNGRGEMLTEYVKAQRAQARGLVKTAEDAAAALQAHEGD